MRILITQARFGVGGTETYSMTVAEHLEQLGHEVTVGAAEVTPAGRELAASRGVRLAVGDPGDFGEVDAVVVQDAASGYLLGARRPDLPQVSVIHGLERFEQPARLAPPPVAIVLNDRVGRHAAALAWKPEVVRLRQPIDTRRLRPRAPIGERARRVLLLSNYLGEQRLEILQNVCDELGMELVKRGATGTTTTTPADAIAAADIVIGYGRSVLEGMAMGRAAYVWDHAGGDGWVTPETYPMLEADGFSGAATDDVLDGERLRADLAAYGPRLGAFTFDLVRKHHSAVRHAETLVALLGQAEVPLGGSDLETISLLVRAEARSSFRVSGFETENQRIWRELGVRDDRAEAAEAALAAERQQRLAAERQLAAVVDSRSWRLTRHLRRFGSLARRG